MKWIRIIFVLIAVACLIQLLTYEDAHASVPHRQELAARRCAHLTGMEIETDRVQGTVRASWISTRPWHGRYGCTLAVREQYDYECCGTQTRERDYITYLSPYGPRYPTRISIQRDYRYEEDGV